MCWGFTFRDRRTYLLLLLLTVVSLLRLGLGLSHSGGSSIGFSSGAFVAQCLEHDDLGLGDRVTFVTQRFKDHGPLRHWSRSGSYERSGEKGNEASDAVNSHFDDFRRVADTERSVFRRSMNLERSIGLQVGW
jgi:hypothetical protein